MSEDGTTLADQGQAEAGSETTATQPAGTESTTEAQTQTQQKAETGTTDAGASEQFYDPSDLPAELQPHFKRMQRSFTKKMQSAKDLSQKAAMVDQFNSDPVGFMTKLAQQHGYTLSKGQQQQLADSNDWQPQTWNEVLQKATEQAEQNILGRLGPVIGELRNVKKSQIENTLDENAPGWREYEDDMIALVNQHPTLANDPEKLVRMAIPPEVVEGRAMQKALKKLQDKGEAAKVSKGTQTTQPVGLDPNRKPSFQEAISMAKKQMQSAA